MHARYYSPTLHRFLSPDPVYVNANTALNFNRYSYALNSPYANYDPSGRDSACFYDGKTYPCDYHDPNAPQEAAAILGVASAFFGVEALYAGLVLEDTFAAALYGQASSALATAGYFVNPSPSAAGNLMIDNQVATLQANGLGRLPIGGLVDVANYVYQVAQSVGLFDTEQVTSGPILSPPTSSDVPTASGSQDVSQSADPFYSVPNYDTSSDNGGN
jgi:hypothetical protein